MTAPDRATEVLKRAFGHRWEEDSDHVNLFSWIINAIDAAVAEEREACARDVGKMLSAFGHPALASQIEPIIRARS